MSRLPPAPRLTADALNAATGAAPSASVAGQRQRTLSQDSHGSGSSSHSSHSSHQERQRAQHLGEAPGGPPSAVKPIASAIFVLLFLFCGQLIAFWLFTRGFLLTRTTLDGVVSTCSKKPQTTWATPSLEEGLDVGGEERFARWEDALVREAECTLPPKYKRSLVWIIDALRYDFIADVERRSKTLFDTSGNQWKPNENYHGILDSPSTIDAQAESYSILSHFLADAPTTTLQRLKGLTTGSLPTFIDAGSNFGGSEITEDNWLLQLRSSVPGDQNAKMGMAGDDTWLTVFPRVFDELWRFPFDSFNVEDLDGVDRGVEAKLKPFLTDTNLSDWRLLVAHTLGVDHVGHRLGASHPRMRSKLLEMKEFLDFIITQLPDDALLVFMGDHGMDEKGDHGGDGELEVGAALWMYNKKRRVQRIRSEDIQFIVESSNDLVSSHVNFSMLPSPPFDTLGHRSVQQIDLVPTMSLLLGLPIPFNNLGSVIPEAFDSMDILVRALRINALQIHRYLDHHARASSDLQPFQHDLRTAWRAALQADARLSNAGGKSEAEQLAREAARAYMLFNRLALVRAKSVWAKFEDVKILIGLGLMLLNLTVIACLKRIAGANDVESLARLIWQSSCTPMLLVASSTLLAKIVSAYIIPLPIVQTITFAESAGVGAALGGQAALLFSGSTTSRARAKYTDWSWLGFVVPILHAAAFSSNSFTVHEDKVVLALLATLLLVRAAQGYFNAPTLRLKMRMPLLALTSTIAVRIASLSRVCREEQAPSCSTTFYVQGESTLNSPLVIVLAYGCALGMPWLLKQALQMSKSDAGIAPLFFTWILRPSLLAGTGFWLIDWLLTSGAVDIPTASQEILETAKLALARSDFALVCIIAVSLWVFSPLCLEMRREDVPAHPAARTASAPAVADAEQGPSTRIVVLGFANSFGSLYMLFVAIVFALHFLVAQPMGQITLSLAFVTIVALAELGDHERDVELYAAKEDIGEEATLPISMLETSTLALLGFLAFFSTGHQATFASIQWRTAFVGFRTVQYPFSPLLVILNSFGPLTLIPAIAVPLLVLWNLAPKPRRTPPNAAAPMTSSSATVAQTEKDSDRMPTIMHVLQASLSFLLYHSIIAIATAVFAAHFRRHLMLFKIWTPRFMLGAVSVQLTYVGLFIGLVASGTVMNKVAITFGSSF